MKVVLYANCQAGGLAHFLKKRMPVQCEVFHNYQLILGEQKPDDLRRATKDCDWFIYQPTDSDRHGELASGALLELLPPHAQSLSFAYQFNTGFFPLVELGDLMGSEHMPEEYWTIGRNDLSALYDQWRIDFGFLERFQRCLEEQYWREHLCVHDSGFENSLRTYKWIIDNSHQELFLNHNHPASALFAELARQAAEKMTGKPQEPIPFTSENEAELPCCMPVSAYTIREYGWKRDPHEAAHERYREMLLKVWDYRRTGSAKV